MSATSKTFTKANDDYFREFVEFEIEAAKLIGSARILALVPARGGSKGLPRKNVREVGGKPLIAWTIEAAKASRYVDRLILSSDDDEIINVAKRLGCDVPFRRTGNLRRMRRMHLPLSATLWQLCMSTTIISYCSSRHRRCARRRTSTVPSRCVSSARRRPALASSNRQEPVLDDDDGQ